MRQRLALPSKQIGCCRLAKGEVTGYWMLKAILIGLRVHFDAPDSSWIGEWPDRTPGPKTTATRRLPWIRNLADGLEDRSKTPGLKRRDRVNESLCIWVTGVVEKSFSWGCFENPPHIHNGDLAAKVFDHSKIM